LSAADIPKIFYAPHKVFQKIVENPKYLGPILVFIIFLAAQTGFYYSLYSKTYYEQTQPEINHLETWTQDASLWTVSSGVSISQNYQDFLNSSFYGNSSMEFAAAGSNMLSMEVNVDNVDCGISGFQNLSMRIKQVDPQAIPSSVMLTLFSLDSSNSFQYDLTSDFSNSSLIGVWNNITVPVGVEAPNWQINGSPKWENITSLKVDFNFASESSITLRVEGLFFRGVYATPVATDFGGFLIYVLQLVIIQYLAQWLLFTGLMYIIIKGLKGSVVWRPLFIAVGFALAVTIVQALFSIASTAGLPAINYPVELLTSLSVESQTLLNSIAAQTANYSLIVGIVQLAIYVWLVALGAFIVKALQPEFNFTKSILTSAAAFIVMIIITSILGV
jgi:hypothetical protein